jgi:hypothetical protein
LAAFDGATTESRYWIGVMASDGYVLDKDATPRFGVSMVAPDGAYLSRMYQWLGNPAAPARKVRPGKRDVLTIHVRSRELCAALASWGIVPRKSSTFVPPVALVADRDYWRGVVDGDGWVSIQNQMPVVGVTGTQEVCAAFGRWAHQLFPRSFVIPYLRRGCWGTAVLGEAAKQVLAVLYADAFPALPRKQEKALEVLRRFEGKTFRTLDIGPQITDETALPLLRPSEDKIRAGWQALVATGADAAAHDRPVRFRHYDGPLRASQAFKTVPRTGLTSTAFHDEARWHARHLRWRSPAEVWNTPEDRARILAETLGYTRPVHRAVTSRGYLAAHMNPGAIRAMLLRLGSRRILDPCAGWGDRLAAALSLPDLECYHGFDPNRALQAGYTAQLDRWGAGREAWVLPQAFEDAVVGTGAYDTVLTSPPYFDTEHYSEDPDQSFRRYSTWSRWVDGFYHPMIIRAWGALRPGGSFALCVANVMRDAEVLPMIETAESIMRPLAGEVAETWALVLRTRKGRVGNQGPAEPVLVWRKPA